MVVLATPQGGTRRNSVEGGTRRNSVETQISSSKSVLSLSAIPSLLPEPDSRENVGGRVRITNPRLDHLGKPKEPKASRVKYLRSGLSLAGAITIHKCQGLTIPEGTVLNLEAEGSRRPASSFGLLSSPRASTVRPNPHARPRCRGDEACRRKGPWCPHLGRSFAATWTLGGAVAAHPVRSIHNATRTVVRLTTLY